LFLPAFIFLDAVDHGQSYVIDYIHITRFISEVIFTDIMVSGRSRSIFILFTVVAVILCYYISMTNIKKLELQFQIFSIYFPIYFYLNEYISEYQNYS